MNIRFVGELVDPYHRHPILSSSGAALASSVKRYASPLSSPSSSSTKSAQVSTAATTASPISSRGRQAYNNLVSRSSKLRTVVTSAAQAPTTKGRSSSSLSGYSDSEAVAGSPTSTAENAPSTTRRKRVPRQAATTEPVKRTSTPRSVRFANKPGAVDSMAE
ncbi:hypothetical protein HDV05_007522 [Chytridiales sp. JEL 0842]|nr:hypothetical protein HDV05_007522 [Chytridiales sp. JEL 0842]